MFFVSTGLCRPGVKAQILKFAKKKKRFMEKFKSHYKWPNYVGYENHLAFSISILSKSPELFETRGF